MQQHESRRIDSCELFRMSSSLTLDLSHNENSNMDKNEDNEDGFSQMERKPRKIIPIGKKKQNKKSYVDNIFHRQGWKSQ